MIPIHLRISGFLSYRERAELDFTAFDLACISGHNGAGKSSLLDAITWALFGEARGKSSEVINLNSSAAEVVLTFTHEDNTYRIQRTLPRNKSTVLEFQIKNDSDWRPLTEKTTRETQARIEQTLRLDYDTFVNASFFLQGKADQFTQQNAGKRKEVLSNILGLGMWEEYKNRSAERRKTIEREVDGIQARISEIDTELAEEESRKTRLAELESLLTRLTASRTAQVTVLESLKMTVAALDEQRKLVDTLNASLERSRSHLSGLSNRLAIKQADRDSYADLVNRAKEIESTHKEWQKIRKQLEEWDKTASQFHEHEKDRGPLLERIAVEKAKLAQELELLQEQEKVISEQSSVISELNAQIYNAQQSLQEAEARVAQRTELERERNTSREKQAAMKVENETLR